MTSPFPGMDPYVEACGLWEDFRSHLIEAIADTLSAQVPERYLVRTGERAYIVVVESEGKAEHVFKPDIGSSSREVNRPRGTELDVAVAAPDAGLDSVAMRAFIAEEFRATFVEIHALEPTRHLVTCLEVLSLSNKRPGTPGWELYLRKRQGLLLGEANLVEVDLLRGGQKFPMLDPGPDSPYTFLIARRGSSPLCRVWPAHFMRPVPAVPVPLARPDPDVSLGLQAMIDAIYARYRYDRDIDYTRALSPALSAEQESWLAEQVRSRGT